MSFSVVDLGVIVLYFVLVVGAGVWFRRRAARGLDAYFLGGKDIPWLALAVSGASSMFDVTGTMWIVTLIVLFGFKSMWNHWMWGFLMGAFFMSFMGKWVRRSGVLTGAEWMITRFGDRAAGRTARTAYALMAVVTLAAFIGYAFVGIGKFVSVYVPWDPRLCAIAIFALTTIYVLLGGLYSVVVTELIQTAILTAASILIACVAYAKLTPETLSGIEAARPGFYSILPVWRLDPAERAGIQQTDYAVYEWFGLLVIAWVLKGLLLNFGGPAQMSDFQRFLAARNARDAAKLGAAWSVFMIVRWALAAGLALLAIQAGSQLKFDPNEDAERLMPLALGEMPSGLRGLVIAGLLAAFMASFSAMVNAGASYVVRDFWQPLVGIRSDGASRASRRHLIGASYAASLALVAVGIVIGLSAQTIGGVFNWIMMALGGAFAIPNVLRWYWWRMNGWGYAIGTLVGLLAAGVVPFVPAVSPMYVSFPMICAVSLVGTLAATLATRPAEESLLVSFYRSVRPFGFWGPIRQLAGLQQPDRPSPSESGPLALGNTVLGGVAILGAYLCPMYLVAHWHGQALGWAGAAAAAGLALYFSWYRTLPEAEPAEPPVSA
ncbi:MAG: sodium:solute symporter family transporter [Thermoguttaceae bacterium]